MTVARSRLIDVKSTPYYHIINRCVRRAYLCGEDAVTGKSFEHRREWIVNKIHQLASIFCIDICAYAVMSNHYHLVLKIDVQQQKHLSNDEVIERWTKLFHPPVIIQRYFKQETFDEADLKLFNEIVDEWRYRLANMSWFMRYLNEGIARKANKEDECKGVFWDGRFKSQALLDEQALLTCMMYVDLNPIRAGMAKTIEDSDFTSIQRRLRELAQAEDTPESKKTTESQIKQPKTKLQLKPLLHFDGATHQGTQHGLPFHLADYLELIDWTGRAIRPDKQGSIISTTPKLLTQLGISPSAWKFSATEFNRQYAHACGSWLNMCEFKARLGGKWCRGKQHSERLYQ